MWDEYGCCECVCEREREREREKELLLWGGKRHKLNFIDFFPDLRLGGNRKPERSGIIYRIIKPNPEDDFIKLSNKIGIIRP